MGNELSFHKMELRNDECPVQVERIDPTEWAHNQVAAAYLATEDSLLILWPQAAGLLKFPSLSFSLSVPLPPNSSFALMRLVATSYSCQCTCFSSSVGVCGFRAWETCSPGLF